MNAFDRELPSLKGKGIIPERSSFSAEEVSSSVRDLADAVKGLGEWTYETKVNTAWLFKNNSVKKIFSDFISKSRSLQEDLDLNGTLDLEDLKDLKILKEQLRDVIQNQYPELLSDHPIYHMIEFLSLSPNELLQSLCQNRAQSLHAGSIEESTLAVNGYGKLSANQPFWTKVVSGLPESQSDIILTVPGVQKIRVFIRNAAKREVAELLPIISHILLTGQKVNYDHAGIQLQTIEESGLPIQKPLSSMIAAADEVKKGEMNFRSAYLIRKLTGAYGSRKSFSQWRKKIESIRPVSDSTMKKLEEMYRENKKDFRKAFEKWMNGAENCRQHILKSLSETGKFPQDSKYVQEQFETDFMQMLNVIFGKRQSYYSKSNQPGENSLYQDLMGIKEDIVEGNPQRLTDSFDLMGLDPETFYHLYPERRNFSDAGSRMIARADMYRNEGCMLEEPGPYLAKRHYQEMEHGPQGSLLLGSAFWESEVSKDENPYFQNGNCILGMAKYSKLEKQWISAKETVIAVDISHLPIDNRKKVEVFFEALKNVCLANNPDPKSELANEGDLFNEKEIDVLADYLLAFKDVAELAMAKVRYSINFPDVKIPGVRKIC